MPNRTDPFHYHFSPNSARPRVYPSSPPPGSPPNEFRDEFDRPVCDADFMLSMASIDDLGGPYYTIAPPSPRQPPARRSRPFPSNPRTVVEEMEVGSEDDDDDGLELRRMGSKDRACGSGGGVVGGSRRHEDDDGEASLAALESGVAQYDGAAKSRAAGGSVSSRRRSSQQQKDSGKRRLSVQMITDAITDIKNGIKKRTDSLVWRKDSGVELQEESLPQRSSDETRTTSGDDTPSLVQLRQESRQFDALAPPRLSESAIVPFEASVIEQLERVQQSFQQQYPGVLNLLSKTPQHARMRYETFEHVQKCESRTRMAMMERQLRIAERQGAFDDAKRKKMFKGTYSHRCNQRQQSQASVKLKAQVVREQKKADEKFWQSQGESTNDAWDRFRRWSRVRVGIAGERSAGDESGYASDNESPSPRSEMRDEQRKRDAKRRSVARRREEAQRREDAEMARYAGTALRSAPFIF